MKILDIRSEFEKSIGLALPGFRRFNARVTRILESELPAVNLFFHKDCLIKNQNFHEDRAISFEIEACFKAGADAEAELVLVRKMIEDAIESNERLENIITDWSEEEVDFAHEMIGGTRIAALAMSYRVEYMRPLFLQEASARG